MKIPLHVRFSSVLVVLFLSAAALIAQNDPPSAPSAPANAERPATPEPESAPETPERSDAPEAPDPAATENEQTELRRLDQPDDAAERDGETAAENGDDKSPASSESESSDDSRGEHHRHRGHLSERVSFWENSTLAENEAAAAVVSIAGSSTSAGYVQDAVVSILGSSTSTGSVGDAVVSILGSSRASGGRVGGPVVSILGNTYVDTEVGDVTVAVLGNVELGPNAVVRDVVCVGGVVKRDPGAVVHGQVTNAAFALNLGGFEWFHAWISRCLMLGRPLAFGDNLMWAWWIAIGFLGLYVVLALLFPRGVEKCAETLETHPGYSLLTALLVTICTPLAAVVLAITIVGAPVLFLALFVAGVFGKVVMLAWIGRRLTKVFGNMAGPALAVLLGGVIVLLLYTVPVLGFILFKFLGWLGLGAVVYAIVLNAKRPRVVASAAVSGGASTIGGTSVVAPTSPSAPLAVVVPSATASSTEAAVPPASAVPPVPPVMPVPPVPVVVSAATLPRAGFWIRIAASLIDVLIVALASNLIPDRWQPNLLGIFAAYCCVLWGMKGTTVGGIICGLKIVRLDDRKVDWPTAIVRVLGGFLSLAAAGIGFIWVAFDEQRQSWHDKIAGTTIVNVPKGVSLV